MAERVKVECSCGKPFTTAVRGRGTHCPACGRTLYVRTDGTVRPRGAAPPAAGGRAKARRSAPTPAAVVDDPGPPDHRTATDEEWLARELWEFHQSDPGRGVDGHPVEQLAALSGRDGWPRLTVAKVRRLIAAEVARQERVRAAADAAPARGRSSRNPRRRAA